MGVLAYCNDNGIHVPQKIKLIGFSNWFMSQVVSPKLSTVEQPSFEMGKQAFNVLLEEINAKKVGIAFSPKTIELDTTIIEREST